MSLIAIRINNAKFYAYHGVLEYEKEYGNGFEVDIEMQCDLSGLENSDDLSKTVNYLSVYNKVKEIFHSEKFNLIETVNQKICDMILSEYNLVKSVRVSIRTRNAPLGLIDSIEIVNEKARK